MILVFGARRHNPYRHKPDTGLIFSGCQGAADSSEPIGREMLAYYAALDALNVQKPDWF
jgi:hypothetical protein